MGAEGAIVTPRVNFSHILWYPF